jgi:tripartite-type tricarboxylate transporter receptor subunit TctC
MKKLPRRQFLHHAAGAAVLPFLPGIAHAQSYPARPVRMIVPYSPGGPTDVCARFIAQKLSERLGQQFYVENIAGAGGNIGTGQAARTAADGYTVLVTVNSYVINPNLYPKVPYRVLQDFDSVTLAVGFPSAMVVNPSVPATTVKELVALIKQTPGKFSFASPGFGTPSHLLGEQFRVVLGLDLVHVPYGGSGPSMMSAAAGDTPIAFAALSSAVPLIKDGRLRALAVMSKNRSPALPDLPTIGEAGYPGLDGDAWIGALVPTGTPKDIVTLLQHEIADALAQPDMKEKLATLGLDPIGSTPEEFTTQMKFEMEKWAKVIEAAKIKAE